jgi:nucleoside-diphosphate-sugar epimerase
MKTLITGAAGFVGQVFVRELRKQGHDLTCVDIAYDWRDSKEAAERLNYLKSPVRVIADDCRTFFREDHTHYDLVVHLAAIIGGRQTIEGQPLAVAQDLSIDAEFFNWVLREQPDRVIYYSSSAAYPIAFQGENPVALTESMVNLESPWIGVPDMSYGWSKLTGELLASYLQKAGQRVHIFRPFSGYGETQLPDYPAPAIVARAVRREDPLTIWADTTRDFIHIDDVVAATLKAVDLDVEGPTNLCSGVATSFTEFARLAADLVGYSPEIVVLDDKPTGVQSRVGDPSKMHDFFKPTIALDEGIGRIIERMSK